MRIFFFNKFSYCMYAIPYYIRRFTPRHKYFIKIDNGYAVKLASKIFLHNKARLIFLRAGNRALQFFCTAYRRGHMIGMLATGRLFHQWKTKFFAIAERAPRTPKKFPL